MALTLNQLGQVSLTVDDVDAAERFYGETLGLRKLFRFGDLVFFDCSGVRLFIEKSNSKPFTPASSILYFRTPDIGLAFQQLKSRGVSFVDTPHMIAPMEDHDLWMTFFKDPSGNTMALMHEAPKGYRPKEDQV
jgi:catechol 2,3-dioxygenase-like lactoylglutathione lyase family enzyme